MITIRAAMGFGVHHVFSARMQKKIDDSNSVCMCLAYSCLFECGLSWLLHCMKRKTLRDKFNLREDPSCGDCLTTLCCGPCALCQEARFLKARSMY